mgnify:CR=1 FL=1
MCKGTIEKQITYGVCSRAMSFGSMYSPRFFTGDGGGNGGLSTVDPYRTNLRQAALLQIPDVRTLLRAIQTIPWVKLEYYLSTVQLLAVAQRTDTGTLQHKTGYAGAIHYYV